MSFEIFDDSIDIAVVGITNSGKSTFIKSFFNKDKMPSNISELNNNDGGLTKVTTYYRITDCESAEVIEVKFNEKRIVEGIEDGDVKTINGRLKSEDYGRFNIDEIVLDGNGSYKESLKENLDKLGNKIKNDLKTAINYINMDRANLLIKFIKINIPASKEALEIMSKYKFKSIVLRDTKGFLDDSISNVKDKFPTLSDMGLDGIQACVFMNGQDLVMPSLGREIYGEFVKSIFESVPTFIIERNAKLAGKLEDYLEDKVELNSNSYEGLIKNPKIANLNFNEMNKFLKSLGIIDDKGISANDLIENNKRQLILPEVAVFKGGNSDDKEIYEFCILEVFEKLLKELSEFRSLLNKVINFFDEPDQLNAIHDSFFKIFYEDYFNKIIEGYHQYYQHNYQLVRPVTQGYTKERLLNDLVHKQLLGPQYGISTRANGEYSYGATGVFAATSWNVFQRIIVDLERYKEIFNSVEDLIGSESEFITDLFILEIQQSLRYLLQNSYTDINSNFSGYSIIDRDYIVKSIENMKKLWNEIYSKEYGNNAIDSVYLIEIKEYIEKNIPYQESSDSDYIRYSQLYISFREVIKNFFELASNSEIRNNTIKSLKLSV